MEFKDYWKMVVKKYPAFKRENARINISVASLKALMEQAHDHGADDETKRGISALEQILRGWR